MALQLSLPLRTLAAALAAITLTLGCGAPDVADSESSTQPSAAPTIHLYGRDTCGICVGFRSRLNKRGRAYVWHDVGSQSEGQAMWALVQRARPGSQGVRFPVIQYGKEILVSPTWEEFQPRLDAEPPARPARGGG